VAGAIQSGRKAAERIEAYLAQLPRPAEATATAAV